MPLYLEYEFGTRDWGALAARVKDANPDFLWIGALGLDGNQLLEAMKKLDYTPPAPLPPVPGAGAAGGGARRQARALGDACSRSTRRS